MREIKALDITKAVCKMCMESNYFLNEDVLNAIKNGIKIEESPLGCGILSELIKNADIAAEKNMPICQDTGMAVVFVDIGQDVHITGGFIGDAINEGVREGYKEGWLRKSVVEDPIFRKNTGDNTPAIIHYKIKEGDIFKLTVAPKGFGSENMSRIYMLKPSDGIEGIKKAVLETVSDAGGNPCPPIVIGIGIGGDFESAAIMAKEALLRPVGSHSGTEYIKELEDELLSLVNKIGIGPQGLGGRVTALGVNINTFPTHIAGMPLAINISCHVTRHAEREL
ncbi:MAG: fumarate hydratase [Lachnospiraceae bacterium]|nr:fumarate hydratase [Lachnospiraceae bacterium]